MKVALTGGGSGGHITPILAIADELKRLKPDIEVVYIGQTGDSLSDIPASHPSIDKVYSVRAGKFRRYHGEGLKQLLDIRTMYLNVRDSLYVIIGLIQSFRLMRQLRPDVLFSRGGFVSVPVALGAKLRGIPYITHDSDATPSLANRIIAPWARVHAVALSKELYPYTVDKTITTGIPLNKNFNPIDNKMKKKYRDEINIPHSAHMVFVIGGGLGSQDVNHAVAESVPHLLKEFPDLYVVQSAGRNNESTLNKLYKESLSESENNRVKVHGFIGEVYKYSGAADIVVTRAGATNLAEFAIQGKACIVIPSSFLAGGHQLKNAKYLEDRGAVDVLQIEELLQDPNKLARKISNLLRNPKQVATLEEEFGSLGQSDAANKIAKIILNIV